jgi:hypothetical protein
MLDSRLTWAEYSRVMRKGVIRRILERQMGPEDAKSELPQPAAEQARAEAEHSIEVLASSGVRIVGDLDSLRRTPAGSGGGAPITHVPLDIAAEAVVGAIAVATRKSWSLDASPPQPTLPTPPEQPRPRPRGRPVDAIGTGELARILEKRIRAGLRRRYRRRRS